MSGSFLKGVGVIITTLIITTLGVTASDWFADTSLCPADMVVVTDVPGVTCVDRFEAAPDTACPQASPDSPQATLGNLSVATCRSTGDREGVLPWRFVAREEARQLCSRAGKRLPSAAEWYQIALSVPVSTCVLSHDGPKANDAADACRSAAGVVHLPGNVWEWVSDDIIDGQYMGRALPASGYVAASDASGIVSVSSSTPVEAFGADYVRLSDAGLFGMVRGGFYGSGEDGGLYSIQANIPPTCASAGIGFRCVK